MKEERLDGLKQLLEVSQRIVVTNHVNPDGDAMGSALGLAKALKKIGHTVSVVVPNDYPSFLKWMPGNGEVVIAEAKEDQAQELIAKADIIFCLDYNAYARAANLEGAIKESSGIKVLIDHHRQPESWPDYIYSDTDMSSTSQMIYEWLEKNAWLNLIDLDIAKCLYTGMVTDTGSFRFAVTNGRTMHVAANLLQAGVKPNEIYDLVFDANSIGRLRLLGAMLDKMEHYPENGAIILHLTTPELMKNNYQKGDSEGFVNYGLSISGVRLSIFLREDKDVVKVSLRSKGDVDVNEISRAHFNGGGHVNAAGGMLRMDINNALNHAREVIKNLEV